MISVAMCTYNGEKYVEEQLMSILTQSTPVDEIIICDDRSIDNTIDVVNKIKKQNKTNTSIQVHINEKNEGVTKNFEGALKRCKGDIIFLSDQDDIWVEQKVEKTLEVLNRNKECQLVFSDAYLVDSAGFDTGVGLWELTKPVLKENYSTLDFTGARFITGATVAIRKELLEWVIPIPDCWIHDAWIATNASVYGRIKYIDEKLIKYRQHENNVIGAKKRGINKQIHYTKKNIQKSIEFRQTMHDRLSVLYVFVGDLLADNEKKDLLAGISFWGETSKIPCGSRWKSIKVIFKNLCNGSYSRYNHGIYGAIVDLYIAVNSIPLESSS